MNQVLPHDFAGFAAVGPELDAPAEAFWLNDAPLFVTAPPEGTSDYIGNPPPKSIAASPSLPASQGWEPTDYVATDPILSKLPDGWQDNTDATSKPYQRYAEQLRQSTSGDNRGFSHEGEQWRTGRAPIDVYRKSAELAAVRDALPKDSPEWKQAYRELQLYDAGLSYHEDKAKAALAARGGKSQAEYYARQQAKDDKIAQLPPVLSAMVRGWVNLEAKTQELGALALGMDSVADDRRALIEKNASTSSISNAEMGLLGDVNSAVESITEVGTLGLAAPATAIPYVMVTSGRQAFIDGKDAGLSDKDAYAYSGTVGVVEGALTYLGQKLLGGGIENPAAKGLLGTYLAKQANRITPAAIKPLLSAGGHSQAEAVEELAVESSLWLVEQQYGTNDDTPLRDRLWKTWKVASIAGGGASAARSAIDAMADSVQSARKVAADVAQAITDAQNYEGDPPRTNRRNFNRDTKARFAEKAERQAYREVFSQAVAMAQSEVTSQVQTETAGRFDSQTVDTTTAPPLSPPEPTQTHLNTPGDTVAAPESVENFPPFTPGAVDSQLTANLPEAGTRARPTQKIAEAETGEHVPQTDPAAELPTTAPERLVDASPDPMVRDTTLEAQELANAELEDLAQRYTDSQRDRQRLTPQEVENLNSELRKWTADTDLVRDVMAQGSRDVRIPSDVLSLAQEYYDRDQELYQAATSHLTQLDIPWQRLIKEVKRDQDREVEKIAGYDDALMALTRARFGDDFVQDNVDVAADELRELLDGAEVRFGQVVFPGLAEPPTKEAAISAAYSDIMEGVNQQRAEEQGGWAPGSEWYPEEGTYLEPPTEVEYDPSLTTARMKWMRRDRESLGLDPLDSPERRTWQQALQSAKERGLPDQAMGIAAEVNKTPRALDDRETAGLVVKAAELKASHRQKLDALRVAEEGGDEAEVKGLSAEVNRIEADFDALSRALKVSGTEKGRALASQKLTIDQDFELTSILARATAAKGAKISPSERRAFQAIEKKLRDTEAKLQEVEFAAKIKATETALGIGQRGRNRTRPIPEVVDQTYNQLAELLKNGCAIG